MSMREFDLLRELEAACRALRPHGRGDATWTSDVLAKLDQLRAPESAQLADAQAKLDRIRTRLTALQWAELTGERVLLSHAPALATAHIDDNGKDVEVALRATAAPGWGWACSKCNGSGPPGSKHRCTGFAATTQKMADEVAEECRVLSECIWLSQGPKESGSPLGMISSLSATVRKLALCVARRFPEVDVPVGGEDA
jgi:hypothetical protein